MKLSVMFPKTRMLISKRNKPKKKGRVMISKTKTKNKQGDDLLLLSTHFLFFFLLNFQFNILPINFHLSFNLSVFQNSFSFNKYPFCLFKELLVSFFSSKRLQMLVSISNNSINMRFVFNSKIKCSDNFNYIIILQLPFPLVQPNV
jgi:hypothetical protein